MGDDKIDEIRREHFGVSDDEAMGADEVSESLQRVAERMTSHDISLPTSFRYRFNEKVAMALARMPPLRVVSNYRSPSGETGDEMSYSEHVSEALAAHRRLEPDTSQQREQERIRLVDGYPGEWEWTGEQWEMEVCGYVTSVWCAVYPNASEKGGWAGGIELRTLSGTGWIVESQETGGTGELVDVAAAIRPHAEAIVKVLEGMGDE